MRNTTSGKSKRLFQRGFLVGALAAVSLVAAPASAAIITLDLTTDVFAGSVDSITDAGGFTGERWFSAPLSFTPITIDQGDQLNLNVLFSSGQGIELASGDFFSGNENIGFLERPVSGISLQGASTLNSFAGLFGDLDAVLPLTTNFSTSGQLSGTIVKDLTDTAFSYGGFSISTTYNVLTGGPATISSLKLFAAADDITLLRVAVTEPASLALMSLGLAGVAFSRRRRAKKPATH